MAESTDPDFTLVRSKKRKFNHTPPKSPNERKKTKRAPTPTPTSNRFDNLSDDDSFVSGSEDEDDLMKTVMENVLSAEMERKQLHEQPGTSKDTQSQQHHPRNNITNGPNPKNRKQRFPPIVMHGNVSDAKKVKIFIEKHTKGKKYEIKWGEDRTTLYIDDNESWTSITDALKKCTLEFHTFTFSNEKTHSFVLSGLQKDTTAEEVLQELRTNEQLQVKNVYEMKNTWTPKFLIITGNSITMKTLENVRVILNTRIKWQRYYNNKKFIQCHRCQEWGHATSNCFANPNCLKCAEGHLTKDCKHDRKNDAKCVNCEGAHPANSTDCPVYKRLLENYSKRTKQTRNQPASQPPPDIENRKEFRPLPRKPRNNAWGNSSETNVKSTPNNENLKNDYDDLQKELQKLNKLINIRKFTENLRKLNSILSACRTESQKFIAMQQFYAEIDSHGE